MTTLADIKFDDLQAGMKFKHPEHGEQIILNLGRNRLGPVIQFHNSAVYNGQPPQLEEEEGDFNIFQAIAQNTYPYGAEKWEYIGMVGPEEVSAHSWRWLDVPCAHCGFVHRLLTPAEPPEHNRCHKCGWHPSIP